MGAMLTALHHSRNFVGLCVRQTWVLLVGKMISVPAPTPILSVRVRPPSWFIRLAVAL